ncbi:hypothetical protein RJ639_031565 [Escallonia herrerae]|uniref:Hemerythrin-like domain-containing protein n=1 Tax=Escallonia herrerae TaxID=1293975 RepID=A0AA88WZE4_9ASTE|nr:hypothetical protein RJ639_031565 [Escallonia herrerae]
MGNCFKTLNESTAEIVPSDFAKPSPAVRLYGSPTSSDTSHIRVALLYKPVSLQFIPSQTPPNFGFEAPVLQYGSDLISGSRATMLRYVETEFPNPPLMSSWGDETTPLVVRVTVLQHRSVTWHVERLVRWAEDMWRRGGKSRGDPVLGSPRMEVRKFEKNYSQLLEVMLDHAQMEEKIVFPILEKADRGLTKAANEEHARDLPIMNGIKEDIKAIGVLDSGTPVYQEALSGLPPRLKTLQKHCREHFKEEERHLLSLMEAIELSKEQHVKVLDQCLDAMHGTHSHLFRFFIEGLVPRDAMQYLDLISRSSDQDRVLSMLNMIV